jgi:nucleotide-binding universal stress UspA family protein
VIKKILAAYDGSEPAAKAYRWALELAKTYAADLLVLSVARPPEPPEDLETKAAIETAQERYEKLFAPMRAAAQERGVAARFELVVGHPAEQIVYRAEEEGVDLIVTGHRGMGFFQRLLVGSVSKQIVSHAPCAVLVVR